MVIFKRMNDNFPKDTRSKIESEEFRETILFEDRECQATPPILIDKEVSIPRLTPLRMPVRSAAATTPQQILHTSLDDSRVLEADSDNDDY